MIISHTDYDYGLIQASLQVRFKSSELYHLTRYWRDPPSGPLSAHLEVYANFALASTRLGSVTFSTRIDRREGRSGRRREAEKEKESARVGGLNESHTSNYTAAIPSGTRALVLRVRLASTSGSSTRAATHSRSKKQSSRSSPVAISDSGELVDTESVCLPIGEVRWRSDRSRISLAVSLLGGDPEEWERGRESIYVFVDALLLSVLSVCVLQLQYSQLHCTALHCTVCTRTSFRRNEGYTRTTGFSIDREVQYNNGFC